MTTTNTASDALGDAASGGVGSGAFTPGPWAYEGDAVFVVEYMQLCCGRGYASCCGEPDVVAERHQVAHCAPDNAPLIAAAPDLVDALRELWLRTACGTDDERVAAMSVAGDLLARLGALSTPPQGRIEKEEG